MWLGGSKILNLFLILLFKDVESSHTTKMFKAIGVLPESEAPAPINRQCNWCVWPKCTPSVTAKPDFNPRTVATTLWEQINVKYGFDFMKRILPILASLTELQRQEMEREYRMISGRVSLADTARGLTFQWTWLKHAMVSLATPLQMYYARAIDKALRDRNRIMIEEVYFSLSPCLITEINYAYYTLYGEEGTWYKRENAEPLEKKIKKQFEKELSEDYIDFLLHLTKGGRDSGTTQNAQAANEDANEMLEALKNNNWTKKFREIYTKRSIPQLKMILKQYDALTVGKDYPYVKEFNSKGFTDNPYPSVNRIITDQHSYFAQQLNYILDKETKTDKDYEKLVFIIRGRSDIDFGDIKKTYFRMFKTTIYQMYYNKFERKYREVLLRLAGENFHEDEEP